MPSEIWRILATGSPATIPCAPPRSLKKFSARADLTTFPERFPLVPRYDSEGVRHRAMGNYLIFYRVESGEVVILHVLHGARDYSALLFPE